MDNNQKISVHIIVHQHWDPAWIARRKDTVPQLVTLFNNIIKKMQKYPSYKFVLDGQAHLIEDFIQQLSEEEQKSEIKMIRKFAKERRLMLGPFYSQVDWNLASGELLVRNLIIGHKVAEFYGGVMKAGWIIDVFGFPEATVKILRGFEIQDAFISRGIGIEPEKVKDAYKWIVSDGSSILCFHLIESYRDLMDLSEIPQIAEKRIIKKTNLLLKYSSTMHDVLLFDGYENEPKADNIVPIIKKIGRKNPNYELLISTPEEYLNDIVKKNPSLNFLNGDLMSGKYIASLEGVFSNRMYLKRKQGNCQHIIERWLEPFSTFNYCLGSFYPKDKINNLWKTLLRISAHDEICGCSIDDVHKDDEVIYNEILQKSESCLNRILTSLAGNINLLRRDTKFGFILFNASQYECKGIFKTVIEIPQGIKKFSIVDMKGNIVPFQISKKDGNKWEVYLFVENIPPIGFAPYWIYRKGISFFWNSSLNFVKSAIGFMPKRGKKSEEAILKSRIYSSIKVNKRNRSMENSFIKVIINSDGSLNIIDKVSKKIYRNLNYFKDAGDRGDLYTASCIKDNVFTSIGKRAKIKLVNRGPLFARFKVRLNLLLPEKLNDDRKTRSKKLKKYMITSYVEIKADSPRVDIKTIVFNMIKDHRLRVCFPTDIITDSFYAEKQFDVKKCPVEIEKKGYSRAHPPLEGIISPAWDTKPPDCFVHQNFVDISDDKRGLALISKYIPEFFIAKTSNTIELTLIRGVGWLGLDDLPVRKGRAGWMVRVPDAQCLGIHTFEYSLFPHKFDWLKGNVHKELEKFMFNLKTLQFESNSTNRKIEKKIYNNYESLDDEENSISSFGLISLKSSPNDCLRLTAIKLSEKGEGIIIRFYNPTEKKVEGIILFNYINEFNKLDCLEGPKYLTIKSAYYTNLNEEIVEEIKPTSYYTVPVVAEPKKIVTVKINIENCEYRKAHSSSLLKGEYDNMTKVNFKLITSQIEEREEKIKLTTPQPITVDDLNSEKKRVEEALLEFNKEKEKLKSIERKIGDSEIISDKIKIENQRMKVFKLTEKLQDARYSYLLSQKKYFECLKNKKQKVKNRNGKIMTKSEINKKIKSIQEEIDKMAKHLMKPREERQREEFVIESYKEIAKNK